MDADALFRHGCGVVREFARRYAAFRQLRLEGWVVRPSALKFGADFLLYDGRPSEVHASYAAVIADPSMSWNEVVAGSRLANVVAKDLLVLAFFDAGAGQRCHEKEVAPCGATAGNAPVASGMPTGLVPFLRSDAALVTEVVVKRWHAHIG
mmetsp:Transcript_54759/g.152841  ORF Transcript_54759/g.152841 Transcript_54759/m.152841 type:complete len:151 (-) Transcript_54759:27-479(-)